MAEDTTSFSSAIQAEMLRLAHVYTGKENGAKVTAAPAKGKHKGQLAVEIDLSGSRLTAEQQASGIDAIYAKVVGSSVPDETTRTATSLRVTVPDAKRTADRISGVVHSAAIERETELLTQARAEATERLTYIMGADAAKSAMSTIDRKITPRPLTKVEQLASGPMRDYVNDLAPTQGTFFSRNGEGNSR